MFKKTLLLAVVLCAQSTLMYTSMNEKLEQCETKYGRSIENKGLEVATQNFDATCMHAYMYSAYCTHKGLYPYLYTQDEKGNHILFDIVVNGVKQKKAGALEALNVLAKWDKELKYSLEKSKEGLTTSVKLMERVLDNVERQQKKRRDEKERLTNKLETTQTQLDDMELVRKQALNELEKTSKN